MCKQDNLNIIQKKLKNYRGFKMTTKNKIQAYSKESIAKINYAVFSTYTDLLSFLKMDTKNLQDFFEKSSVNIVIKKVYSLIINLGNITEVLRKTISDWMTI